MLASEQIATYKRDGFVSPPEPLLSDAEVERLRAAPGEPVMLRNLAGGDLNSDAVVIQIVDIWRADPAFVVEPHSAPQQNLPTRRRSAGGSLERPLRAGATDTLWSGVQSPGGPSVVRLSGDSGIMRTWTVTVSSERTQPAGMARTWQSPRGQWLTNSALLPVKRV